jgi:hypothetical protein
VFTVVDDRHDIRHILERDEQQLALGAGRLRHELDRRVMLTTVCLVHLTEPAASDPLTDDPFPLPPRDPQAAVRRRHIRADVIEHLDGRRLIH